VVEASAVGPHLEHNLHDGVSSQARARSRTVRSRRHRSSPVETP
jgi:hypothetical protein